MTKKCRITRLRLKFILLGNLKFCCKFKDCLRPIVTVVLKLKQLNAFFLRCQVLASKIHNLHDGLCLIDPPVIGFDEESHLNVLLYGSDEFNDKINSSSSYTKQGRRHQGSHKQKLLKSCDQGENVTVLVMFTVLL